MAKIKLGAWAGKTAKQLDEMARAIQITTFNQCILKTRRDTGRMMGNWQTNVGSPITTEINRVADEDGRPAVQDVEAKVVSGNVMYLTNNVPYCEVYERKDGMMRGAIANLERNTRRAAEEYDK